MKLFSLLACGVLAVGLSACQSPLPETSSSFTEDSSSSEEYSSEEDSSSMHEHSYTATTVAPTCAKQGFTIYICGCGDNYVTDYVDSIPHEYTQEVVTDAYKKSEATCSQQASYYYSCECGAKGEETFTYGDILDHRYANTWSYNATHHWKNATCGCDEKYRRGRFLFRL